MNQATAILIFALLSIHAYGKTFYVDSGSFDSDKNPGDGVCSTSSFTCSLKAAIEESNARADRDKIAIPSGKFRTDIGESSSSGFEIRERVQIVGKGLFGTFLSGGRKERHFGIVNEKLIFGLCNGEIGALRPSSGRALLPIVKESSVRTTGAILLQGNTMLIADFIEGVHRFNLRTREQIEASSSKETFSYDKRVIDGSTGNGAGLTAPTALATTKDGDILVNSFQPSDFMIRRYDSTDFKYKGIFISPPGIVNSMVTFGNRVYVTLVSDDIVSAYDADTGKFLFSGNGFLSTPRGIQVCNRRIFVASEKTNTVVEFDENLKYQRIIISDPGRIKDPQGLACLDQGDIFIKTKGQVLLHYKYGKTSSTFVRDLSAASAGNFMGAIATLKNKDFYGGPGVSISKMTLKDGRSISGGYGPSIAVSRGCWTKVSNCKIQKNQGSIFGGAITNYGTMVIEKCRVLDNTMPSYSLDGGGVTNSGGAIANIGRMEIKNSEISNNTAARGGGVYVAGTGAHLTVYQSTISSNFAGNAGGGIYNAQYTEILYSTITLNECGQYRGDPEGRRAGCGFFSYAGLTGGNYVVSIASSIIAGKNQLGNQDSYAPDCFAEGINSVRTYGGNIIEGVDATKCKMFPTTEWDMIGKKYDEVDPKLNSLQKLTVNGKPSITYGHEPLFNSPATSFSPFKTGRSPRYPCPNRDQIGRSRSQNSVCDVGSVERGL